MLRSKRFISLFLLLCVIISCALNGCTKKESDMKSALSALLADIGYTDACALYSCDELLAGGDGGAYLASLFGDDTPRAALYGAEDGALALAKGENGFEIQIYRAGHPSQARDIAGVLRDREAMLKSVRNKRYLAEDFDAYLSSASVYTDGCCVYLLAAGDNDAILRKLEKYL